MFRLAQFVTHIAKFRAQYEWAYHGRYKHTAALLSHEGQPTPAVSHYYRCWMTNGPMLAPYLLEAAPYMGKQ